MTKTLRRVAVVLAALASSAVLAPAALAHDEKGLAAVGLAERGMQLVAFDTANPDDTAPIGTIGGLVGDQFLVGIDFRPSNGALYGVGNAGGLYRVNAGTAFATRLVGGLTLALDGTFFGVDFNPAADALRIVSDTGQNLRVTFVGDLPTANTDAPLSRTGVSGAAYTNNDVAPTTATQLFDIATTEDQLVLQNPPNAGTLTGIGPAGGLGEVGPNAGFDVFSTLDPAGVTVDNDAFAAVEQGGRRFLIAVNLADGSAEDRGEFDVNVADLAIRPAQ